MVYMPGLAMAMCNPLSGASDSGARPLEALVAPSGRVILRDLDMTLLEIEPGVTPKGGKWIGFDAQRDAVL